MFMVGKNDAEGRGITFEGRRIAGGEIQASKKVVKNFRDEHVKISRARQI